ncbi:MAG: glucose-6-phosphate isomerase [Anaerolineales bacterium]|nr:glucose-6-phosphate isomerase [Anaerolineales bacterium]
MPDMPFSMHIDSSTLIPENYDNHIVRRLSAMRGQFADGAAFEAALREEDRVLYEVYELKRPEIAGELLTGISIVHPGKVGEEYNMTKGHFHTVLDTAEVYFCLQGKGMMVMETPEGDWSIEKLSSGRVLYVPPRWAHRSVNTGPEDMITFFVYPAHAGHDYGSIELQGFRKLVVERDGGAAIINNPRWLSPEAR